MKQAKHFTEEQIIDLLSRNVEVEKNEHLSTCETCQAKLENWRHILSHESDARPNTSMKERIWRDLEKNRKTRSKRRTNPAFIFSVGALATILIMTIGFTFSNSSLTPSYEVAFNDDIDRKILSQENTKKVSVLPVKDFPDITGDVWINNETNELLLEVDGLKDISNRDYQLWIVYDEDEMDGEILSIQNGSTRIFMRGDNIGHLQLLKGSVEPLGGSSKPTGPETFVVPLNSSY